MSTGIVLSYSGLGANLLHLAYCHEIAKKYGPVTIITLCKNLEHALSKDPLVKNVIYLNDYNKKFLDIIKLGNFLKELNLINIFIFYPSIRYYLASKIAKINNIYSYPFFKKKKLHLVNAAKKFTEESLKIKDCPTETNFYFIKEKKINKNVYNIVIGAGSSGPTTRWGEENYINLINSLNKVEDLYFFILCGDKEKKISNNIISKIDKKNCLSLHQKTISELLPMLCSADLYIGNDSFGHHITSQSGIPSIVLLLDTPKAYSDYSKNQFRIIPEGADINKISHDSVFNPNSIKVSQVYNKVMELKKLGKIF